MKETSLKIPEFHFENIIKKTADKNLGYLVFSFGYLLFWSFTFPRYSSLLNEVMRQEVSLHEISGMEVFTLHLVSNSAMFVTLLICIMIIIGGISLFYSKKWSLPFIKFSTIICAFYMADPFLQVVYETLSTGRIDGSVYIGCTLVFGIITSLWWLLYQIYHKHNLKFISYLGYICGVLTMINLISILTYYLAMIQTGFIMTKGYGAHTILIKMLPTPFLAVLIILAMDFYRTIFHKSSDTKDLS